MKTQVNITNTQIELFRKTCDNLQVIYHMIEEREYDTRFEVITDTAGILFYLGQGFGMEIGHQINTESLNRFQYGK